MGRASIGRVVTVALLIVLGTLLVLEASFSLEWRMVHDAPLLMYMAYGMSHFGYVPYVDFFDMNAPGSYYFHVIAGRVLGYGDLAFRLTDLLWLGLLTWLTWLTMRRFGRRVASCAAILFGLVYLSTGTDMSLQREYIALVPIAGALLAATSARRIPLAVRWLTVGALFGVAATVKPAAAMGLPIVAVFGAAGARGTDEGGGGGSRAPGLPAARVVLFSALGLVVPLAATALHLARIGALDDFVEIARSYWPLYTRLTRTHAVLPESARAGYLAGEWLTLGGRTLWLLPAAVGVFAALFRSGGDRGQRRLVLLLVALTACYSLYPVIGGKFWTYHWLPFSYFIAVLSSLALTLPPAWKRLRWVPAATLVLVLAVTVRPPDELRARLSGEEWLSPKVRRADRIALYLGEHLRPGDRVQPLDWTGGAVHAMLMSEAQLATPFVYDFHFCHHVSTGYIKDLRRRFLEELAASAPRFIIQVETMRTWVSGEDTERRFRELDGFVAANYVEADAGFGYRIYERAQTDTVRARPVPAVVPKSAPARRPRPRQF